MIRRPPRSTRTDTIFPYTTLFRSALLDGVLRGAASASKQAQFEPNWELDFDSLTTSHLQALSAIDAVWSFWDPEDDAHVARYRRAGDQIRRSEEHTSELQSLMRISYAFFCLKKKKHQLYGAI